jgi:hypothetical protein
MNPQKKGWLALAAATALFAILFVSFADWPSKRDTTLGNISRLGLQVHNFYEANHRLPGSLEELKPDPRFRNDAWGRPITYTIMTSNSYVLRSLGPDGKPVKDNVAYAFAAADLSGVPVQ